MTTIKDELLQRDVEAFYKALADQTAGIVTRTPGELSTALLGFIVALRESKEKISDVRFRMVLSEYAAVLRIPKVTADELDRPRSNGANVRAACVAGVVTDLEEAAVGGMKPWAVRDLATEIYAAITAAYEVPGE